MTILLQFDLYFSAEVFPTCKHLWDFYNENALEGEATVVNGRFTSDPDGAGGVPPFTVECTFPESVIAVEGKTSKSCYIVNIKLEKKVMTSKQKI